MGWHLAGGPLGSLVFFGPTGFPLLPFHPSLSCAFLHCSRTHHLITVKMMAKRKIENRRVL
jgi:hypothetical protein